MTIPGYTSHVVEAPGRAVGKEPATSEGAPWSWRDPIDRRLSLLRAHPRLIQRLLDAAGIGFTILAFATSVLSAEFLFHGVFVVLAVQAFLFGLRPTLIRIAIASVPLLVYANAQAFGLVEAPLELSEWPLMFVIAVIVAWMADRREATSRRYATLFRQAAERLLTVQEDERRRIAGELHDGVGQVLTALTLTLDASATASDPQVAADHLRRARALSGTALAETRGLAHWMRPPRLEERGLVPALRDLAGQSGFPVRVLADAASSDRTVLGPTAMVEVYRVIQEALANAARHSGAARAEVKVTHDGDHLTIEVSDQGRGFVPNTEERPGIGLAGMEERAELIGGILTIASGPGRGTRIRLTVPTFGAQVAL